VTVDPTPTLLAGRYRLGRRLGAGATADVHEAFDTALGATVALKRFHAHTPGALRDLKAEFRTLADIHHPGLVKLFDLVVAPDAAFFTMELVEGVPFTEYMRSASPEGARRAVRRVADAILTLHGHGKLHRDLKPGNVLVTADGDARVLDFGLAASPGASPMAGTLAYMAPELFEGSAPGPGTDWYGLGALLYEGLTGSFPGEGASLAELVLRKRTRRFARPRDVARNAPADLDELAWALLDPDPSGRPSHAAIAAALDAGGSPVAGAPSGSSLLFGRDAELARLRAALDATADGVPALILVEGPSGMGKTALVRELLGDEARRRNCTVLKGGARPQELLPLRAIDAVVDELTAAIEGLPQAARSEVIAAISPSLVQSFPVLASLGGPLTDRAGSSLEALESRREARSSLARVLRALSSSRPLAVWIDDIQWADYESMLFLRALLEGGGGRLFVVLTRRPGALPWTEHEQWLESATHVSLGPLDEAAARSLLRARSVQPHPIAETAASRALAEAGGNAFLIEFFAQHAGAESERVPDLGTALRRALNALAPDARLIFECVALAQHPLPLAFLGDVVVDRSRLRDQAAALTSSRLVSVDEQERVRPYHDTLRDRADAILDAADRPVRHGRIADALRIHRAPAEWQIPHLEGAGRTDAAGQACLVAGDGASKIHAFEIAAQYFQKALALGRFAPSQRAETLEKLSDNLALMGRGREAAESYREAASLMGSRMEPRAVVALQHKRALALLRTGALDEGCDVLRSVLRGVGERLPESTVSALGTFLVERARLSLERRRKRESPATSLDPVAQLRLDALWTAATGLSMYQPLLANALIARFVRHALRANEPRRVVRALAIETVFLSGLGGRYRTAADAIERDLRRRFDDIPWTYERGWVAASIGTSAWLAGSVRECRDWTVRARQIFRDTPETGAFEVALLDAWRLPSMTLVGDFEPAVSAAEDILAVAAARGDQFASLPCLHGYITLAYLAAKDRDVATRRAEEGRVRAEQLASPLPAFHQTWSWTTLALHAGNGAGAYRVVRSDWPRLRRLGVLAFESAAGDLRDLRARAALAAALSAPRRRRADLVDDARAQARWLRSSTLHIGPALALDIEGQIARLEGRRDEAAASGLRAIEGLTEAGLAPRVNAMRRWLEGTAQHPIDAVFVGRA
jgi:hypothetical protein